MSIYDKIVETAITFDDVLLVPSYSEVLPNQVSLKSRLTDKITLNIPIVSAAMDTVTEADLAIALARVGGLGFIHKNMPIEEQASQVNKVKRSENGMITDPVTLTKDHTLGEAKALMERYKISGLPVVDFNNTLIGIITNRDVKYQEDLSIKVESLMTKENLITSDLNTTLETAKEILLTSSAMRTRDCTSSASTALCISTRSPPTEKTFPLALISKICTVSSFLAVSMAFKISSQIGILNPLETSGRFSVKVATPLSTLYRISLKSIFLFLHL